MPNLRFSSTSLLLALSLILLASATFCSKVKHGATDPLAIPGELPNLLSPDARGLLFMRSLDAVESVLGNDSGNPGPVYAWYSSILGFDASALEKGKAAAVGVLTHGDDDLSLDLQPIFRGGSDADLKRARQVKSWSQVKIGNYHSFTAGKALKMDSSPKSLLTELHPGDLTFAFTFGSDAERNARHVRDLAAIFVGPIATVFPGMSEAVVANFVAPALADARALQFSIGAEGNETRARVGVKSRTLAAKFAASDGARNAALAFANAIPEDHSVIGIFGLDMAAAMKVAGPLLTSAYGSGPAPFRIAYSTYFLLYEKLQGLLGTGGAISIHGSENGMEFVFLSKVNNVKTFLSEYERIVLDPGFASSGVTVDSVSRSTFEGCDALQFRLVFDPEAFVMPGSQPSEATDQVRVLGKLLFGVRGLQVQVCGFDDSIVYVVNLPDSEARRVVRSAREGNGKPPSILTHALAGASEKPQVVVVTDLRSVMRASNEMKTPGDKRPLPPILKGSPLPVSFWLRADADSLAAGGSLRVNDTLELWKFVSGG